jgi:hypothetical protein
MTVSKKIKNLCPFFGNRQGVGRYFNSKSPAPICAKPERLCTNKHQKSRSNV